MSLFLGDAPYPLEIFPRQVGTFSHGDSEITPNSAQSLLPQVAIGLAVLAFLRDSTNSFYSLFGADEFLEGLRLDWDPGPGIHPCRPLRRGFAMPFNLYL